MTASHSDKDSQGILYVAATPIGNLSDVSDRLRTTLTSVSLVFAEDTRVCRRLLNHLGINVPVVSCHEHNEHARVAQLSERLDQGDSIALVSDAGTPLVSDPGYRLVCAAIDQDRRVVPIPGPSAITAALSVAGLPVDRFVFEGFLPRKPSARRKYLQTLKDEARTMVFFESSHRIVESIEDLSLVFGDTRVATVAREITKQFETVRRATLAELHKWVNEDTNQQRGEFVVLVSGSDAETIQGSADMERVLSLALGKLGVRDAVDLTMEICRRPRNEIYQKALELSRDK